MSFRRLYAQPGLSLQICSPLDSAEVLVWLEIHSAFTLYANSPQVKSQSNPFWAPRGWSGWIRRGSPAAPTAQALFQTPGIVFGCSTVTPQCRYCSLTPWSAILGVGLPKPPVGAHSPHCLFQSLSWWLRWPLSAAPFDLSPERHLLGD